MVSAMLNFIVTVCFTNIGNISHETMRQKFLDPTIELANTVLMQTLNLNKVDALPVRMGYLRMLNIVWNKVDSTDAGLLQKYLMIPSVIVRPLSNRVRHTTRKYVHVGMTQHY
ncbi:unspecified product [Leishmania tarentolae]|uniref:Unspecified product n=1 Tax=Leishmania tarentolae TaxID=5689 RepID=A0A640KNY4_LEITA|nr:unspecified product [Leishmania tarentolae]